MSSPGCPPEDELVRMVEGALGDASLAAIEAHVDTCESCAAVMAGLGALDSAGMKPRVVGRYQLDRRIGGGGMGEVWAAWDPQLRRDIAVKLVKPERADDGRERERLLREARALARLTHPNVLAVYDVGEIDGEVFIATELVVGDTLASRGGANADWRALVRLYAQAARGLAAAHAAGLVHRDIKPANLLIGTDGRVRVADFGLAVKSATPSPLAATELAAGSHDSAQVQITQTGYVAGTPAYMAPEQRLGEPADARADQYALCVALAEGIAGRRPPLDTDRDAMIAFVAERRAREPDLDRLCGVIARGLSIDRTDRFDDANALADAFEACVAPPPPSTDRIAGPAANAPTRAVSSTTGPARPRGLAIVIVGGAAALAVAGVLVVSRLASSGHGGAPMIASNAVATTGPTGSANDRGANGGSNAANGGSNDGANGSANASGSDRNDGSDRNAMTDATDGARQPTDVATIGKTGSPPGIAPTRIAPIGPGSSAGHPTAGSASGATSLPASRQEQIDEALAAARRAILKRDGRGCFAAIANLPTTVPAMTERNIAFHRAQCEMLTGDCDRGIQHANAAMDGMGSPPNGAGIALSLCPITGPYEVRLQRLVAQAHQQSSPAACRGYVTHAKTLAGEATAATDKAQIGGVLRSLATCIGTGGDCAEAAALWKTAHDLDQIPMPMQIKGCATQPAPSPPMPANPMADVMAFSDSLTKIQAAIARRDLKACRTFVASLTATTVPQGLQQSADLLHGYCEMVTGNCKAGSDLVVKAYNGGVPAATIAVTADTYCPITGTLDQRLTRMVAQLNAFADRRGAKQSVEWCAYLVAPAKLAAAEAATDAQRATAAKVLQHVAWCLGTAKRCDQARDLWALSVSTDANASTTPDLPGCP